MNNEASLQDLIGSGDMQGVFWRSFVQTLIDHGATWRHLRIILEDTKDNKRRVFLNGLVREVMGPIWKRTEAVTDLGEIDYECTIPTMVNGKWACLPRDLRFWSGSAPKAPCRYRLHHFLNSVDPKEVQSADLGLLTEHAGVRELIAYVGQMPYRELSDYAIIAAGSALMERSGEGFEVKNPIIFPKAYSYGGEHRIHQHSTAGGSNLSPGFFFLVRVYG